MAVIRFWFTLLACAFALGLQETRAAEGYFEIQVVDEATGRGVPLVELKMVNHASFVTDSAGRVAFGEPGLWGETVFLHVASHGYEVPKDGFGMAGVRVKPVPGGKEVIRIQRKQIAERLYRITGEGIYRDSVLLGYEAPTARPLLNGLVVGQDSTQPVIYRDKIYWFWGDTMRLAYPLGNFRTAGAVSDLPRRGGVDPAVGINLRYFTDENGFAKKMCPFEGKPGLIWIDGVLTVEDEEGRERMLAHWLRLEKLGVNLEHGICIYNDETDLFDRIATFDLKEEWRAPRGRPFPVEEAGRKYYYFGDGFANVRVPATMEALLDMGSYEAWSCLAEGEMKAGPGAKLNRDEEGKLVYRWTKNAGPMGSKAEQALIAAGLMKGEEAYFQPVDVESGKTILIHHGTVRWNPWRKRWILIAGELMGSSMLGEIWYAEAASPVGPWKKARKIITHNRYDFYNPIHDDFFDQEGRRVIYIEGTYANTFSGNPVPTPRYDYNQVMYRLDLGDERLESARVAAE